MSMKRLDLPSGNWWELVDMPLWKHFRALEGLGNLAAIDALLVSITVAWSFPEEVSIEALGEREARDMIPVLQYLQEHVLPFAQTIGQSL